LLSVAASNSHRLYEHAAEQTRNVVAITQAKLHPKVAAWLKHVQSLNRNFPSNIDELFRKFIAITYTLKTVFKNLQLRVLFSLQVSTARNINEK